MKFNTFLRSAIKESGLTQTEYGEKLGVKQNSVAITLSRQNVTIKKFIIMADVLGYEITARNKATGEEVVLTNDGWVA